MENFSKLCSHLVNPVNTRTASSSCQCKVDNKPEEGTNEDVLVRKREIKAFLYWEKGPACSFAGLMSWHGSSSGHLMTRKALPVWTFRGPVNMR